ncbi:MAG TPA: TIGR00282 family metallophosphoesterase [Thermoanaerobaculales bacterium]|nr:TIGR00282 family metallophosphoesterase [Thermoanaerobaculales bacterium]HPA80181.1 TIGR00282 family metallophosphoesterase [Thermoanaerobaculales bacterium]HQL28666.1 TIGR00282 family metallophosphoesterase [Thermoanaerobaculales bacterium]HQN96733.1 TIGR00282 family metallophosphoesterase [Thermoanaerobaculales bacterium]HQP44310.1 TIGR00282 family metallophosphoesterase [Thermoanaerobaculales bacterium]
MIRILFVGDVMGGPGRRAVEAHLEGLVDRERIDFVVANIENIAGGFGLTAKVLEELEGLPIDVLTSGNHVWDKKEGVPLLDAHPALLRPANYPDGNPGRGWCVEETAAGVPVAVVNLQGQALMAPIDNPFRVADRVLEEIRLAHDNLRVIVVDMHAEATSEKQAMGWHLDGRVTAVLGTHTHVPTADERILPEGTAFQTDVGMTGPYESVIGMRPDKVLERFLLGTPRPFEPAKRDVQLRGAIVDADEETGRALAIRRLRVDGP